MTKFDKLRKLVYDKIDRCEKEIENGGPFYALSAKIEVLEQFLDIIDELESANDCE